MAIFLNDVVKDAALNTIVNNATDMSLCEGYASTAAGGVLTSFTTDGNGTTGELAAQAMVSGDYTLGDYVGGRQIAVAQKSGVSVAANGTGDNVILWNSSTNVVYAHTGLTAARAVTTADTVTFNTWNIQIADPA